MSKTSATCTHDHPFAFSAKGGLPHDWLLSLRQQKYLFIDSGSSGCSRGGLSQTLSLQSEFLAFRSELGQGLAAHAQAKRLESKGRRQCC